MVACAGVTKAYVQYKNDEAMKKALEWNNTWYKGTNITVEKLGEETKGRGTALAARARTHTSVLKV